MPEVGDTSFVTGCHMKGDRSRCSTTLDNAGEVGLP